MDRLTAPSTADWPLPSLPLASLINVPKESKRHCRLLPAGMVNLNLTQMADAAAAAANDEEQRQMAVREEHGKKLDYNKVQVEVAEHAFEKWAFECRQMEKKKRKRRTRDSESERKKIKIVERDSFDEMLEAVDALLGSLESPVVRSIEPPNTPEVFAMDEYMYTPSPTTEVIELADYDEKLEGVEEALLSSLESPVVEPIEPDTLSEISTVTSHIPPPAPATATIEIAKRGTRETVIPAPTPPTASETDTNPAKTDISTTATNVLPSTKNPITTPINPTTALHSHPPSSTERAFALNLSNAHHARTDAAISSHELALPASDAVPECYGKEATATTQKEKKKKLTFSKAVRKGFREIFGEESCW